MSKYYEGIVKKLQGLTLEEIKNPRRESYHVRDFIVKVCQFSDIISLQYKNTYVPLEDYEIIKIWNLIDELPKKQRAIETLVAKEKKDRILGELLDE